MNSGTIDGGGPEGEDLSQIRSRPAPNVMVDQRLLKLARAQHGVLTVSDLRRLGLDGRSIGRRVNGGLLERRAAGLYVVSVLASRLTPLAVGVVAITGALVGFESAAWMHGAWTEPRQPHLLAPHGGRRRVPGLLVHQSRQLEEVDRCLVDRLSCATLERTVCDLAGAYHSSRIRHVIEEALVAGRLEVDALIACHQARSRRGVPGVRTMRAALRGLGPEAALSDSRLEQLLAVALANATTVRFVAQFKPDWYDGVRGIVDLADPVGRTIIEADGRRWHSTTQAFENDRRRDRKAAANGWLVIRVGWRELEQRRASTVSEIVSLVDARHQQARSECFSGGAA